MMYGLCECGCGGKTKLSKQTDRKRGYVKGEPMRFIAGHNISRPTEMVKVKCDYCGKEQEKYPSDAKRHRFCSRKCQGLDLRYSNLAEEGSSYIDYWGYRHIKVGDEWIREHRKVVQDQIGRELTSKEHVHHINGNKSDNRLENLKILSHSEHMKLHAIERDFGSLRPADLERDKKGRFKKREEI